MFVFEEFTMFIPHFRDFFIVFIRFLQLSGSVSIIPQFRFGVWLINFFDIFDFFSFSFFCRFLTTFYLSVSSDFGIFLIRRVSSFFRDCSYASSQYARMPRVVEGDTRNAPLNVRFRRVLTIFTPFLRFFHSFYPFFATISLSFDDLPFFFEFESINFSDFFSLFLVFVFLPILNVFPRFRPFLVLFSCVRYLFRNISYA